MIFGVIYETGSCKYLRLAAFSKWTSSIEDADKYKPSELLEVIQSNGLETLMKKGVLQYHLVSM